jgi:hypothetical protein
MSESVSKSEVAAQAEMYRLMGEAAELLRAQNELVAKRDANRESIYRLLRQFPNLYFDRESAAHEQVKP